MTDPTMTIVETATKAAQAKLLELRYADTSGGEDMLEAIRAALRAVRPEDVSDGMVGACWGIVGREQIMKAEVIRRAIAAALAAGAET